MKKVSDVDLAILIDVFRRSQERNMKDAWVMPDGEKVEPLDVLIELQELRQLKRIKNI